MNTITLWMWAIAAVSKRLVGAGLDQGYLAEFYADNLATKSDDELAAGAKRIAEIKELADAREDGLYATTVEERDELALLLDPTVPES